ncbi:hypothetical protein RTP6_002687 [Batrachochytrium dendrobatidis]
MLGRLLQVGVDVTLVAAVAAGSQRAAGIELNQKKIENDTARMILTSYLRYGDWVIDSAASQLKQYPEWFSKKL